MEKAVLTLDCGATNVKASLIGTHGQIIASYSLPNKTVPDPFHAGGLIWDVDNIWNSLAICSRKICSSIKNIEITAVTVTTFGVDGAAVKKDGTLLYPVISWQCNRTEAIAKNIAKYYDPDWLYRISGLQSYHFNTIYKLVWLRENRPDVLKEMDYYVMLPSLLIYRLCGEFVTDTTSAGTTMLTDLGTRDFSSDILNVIGLSTSIFPRLVEPGTVAGYISPKAAESLGISSGIAAIAAGHDTQFAILASGARINQPILSSGTWEILMVRTQAASLKMPSRDSGVTIELDAQPGILNAGVQWAASGVLEWLGRLLYPDIAEGSSRYTAMIKEAGSIPPGSSGLSIIPELYPGGFSGRQGSMKGFTHETPRAHIYRAGLEALSFYSFYGLKRLELAGN